MKELIRTDKAPAAIGPYSQAVKVGGFVYTAGQIGLHPATGQMVTGGIEAETEQVLKNLTAVLLAAGASLEDVVKTTVFISDMTEFPAMNVVYSKFFGKSLPARSTVQASLPKDARVEIEAVAFAPQER